MTMRMLIDARHPEETRVAVVNGTRIEEFDFEAAARKQIKGNIYLAKVTRVEPSLQAAFIEYGGNRHGFLAFSEIHPDYYQIPHEDREALLREEEAIDREEIELQQAEEARSSRADTRDASSEDPESDEEDEDEDDFEEDDAADPEAEAAPAQPVQTQAHADDHHHERMRDRRMALRRRYKIQDVIKRRQVLLVQVVKEERGNKGAALTTYLSLAGRYCVLMPNTSHGGGISRKISSAADRKRLKGIMDDLQLPRGMACIVRTAGLSRTKTEIKRDFDYLTRLWDDIREMTLSSSAPALIHEDSDLIKRAIRDIYSRDIEEVIVDGDDGYAHARQFMKLLMPSHVRRVKHYIDPIPLFQRAQLEGQLNAMFHPVVQLKSGGYLVINPTEALVSIDINSGRSTREYNIEETALKTNIEAADEIARQLRLRDMAGLVVIDFIDMEHGGNVRKVERQMKEALKNDRARIQVGRISSFGLLEMSRQRLRTGVLEASTVRCPMCEGVGLVRSPSSAALAALRGLEEEAVRGRHSVLTLSAATDVAVYVLNRKRDQITEIEERYGVRLDILPETELLTPRFVIEGVGGPPDRPAPAPVPVRAPVRALEAPAVDVEDDYDEVGDVELDIEDAEYVEDADDMRVEAGGRTSAAPRRDEGERGGRRRRRRRGGRRDEGERSAAARESDGGPRREDAEPRAALHPDDEGVTDPARDDRGLRDEPGAERLADDEARGARRRRRGRRRRGGRGLNGAGVGHGAAPASERTLDADEEDADGGPMLEAAIGRDRSDGDDALVVADALLSAATELDRPILAEAPSAPEPEPEAQPRPKRRTRKAATAPEPDAEVPPKKAAPAKRPRARKAAAAAEAEAAPAAANSAPAPEADTPPKRARAKRAPRSAAAAAADDADSEPAPAGLVAPSHATAPALMAASAGDDRDDGQMRRGWWQRTFGS